MAKRTKAVVQWASKYPNGDYIVWRDGYKPILPDGGATQVVCLSIREIPAKASKRKAVKRGKAK